MKSFAVFAILAFVVSVSAFTEEQLNRGKQVAETCAQEQGIDSATIDKLKAGDLSSNDKKVQCFTNCFLEKTGFLKDGQLQEDVAFEKLSSSLEKSKIQALIDACKTTTGADNCEKAFNLFKCYQTNNS